MPGELFASCSEEDGVLCNEELECSAMGFCTKPCESYEDCTAAGDCLVIGANQRCVPYCTVQEDCDVFSDLATCGYTEDVVPAFGVVVCSQWGDELALPPDGYPEGFACDDDAICNLGFEGAARVCSEAGCVDGCHAATDCPGGAMCSSSGAEVGTCGGQMGESVDSCPGRTVSLTTAMPTAQIMGNTALATPPSESEGVESCTSLTPTEEDIYRVLIETGGTLIVNVESAPGYDPIVYVRTGCDTGTQFECADMSGSGLGEILEFPVFDNDEIWVFVDGFSGSTGSYTIDFDLTVQ